MVNLFSKRDEDINAFLFPLTTTVSNYLQIRFLKRYHVRGLQKNAGENYSPACSNKKTKAVI
jgi:hypothetical protein